MDAKLRGKKIERYLDILFNPKGGLKQNVGHINLRLKIIYFQFTPFPVITRILEIIDKREICTISLHVNPLLPQKQIHIDLLSNEILFSI